MHPARAHTTALSAVPPHGWDLRVCVWVTPCTFLEVTGTRGGSGGTLTHRGLLGHRTAWHPLLVHTGFPLPVSDENLRFRFRRQPTLTLLLRIDPLARINYLYVRYYTRNHGYY